MERDVVFLPMTRKTYATCFGIGIDKLNEVAEESTIYTLIYVIVRQLFGWQVYLIYSDLGQNCNERQSESRDNGKGSLWAKGASHLNPESPIFKERDAKWVILSGVGIVPTSLAVFKG
jgi:omega-6 fatty acid desaturase / acyl-lipid omega-6 desaturase (Delta-12 desaturase)